MDNKYYTPTIDEFRVGFEFEWYDEDDKTWNKTIIKTQSELYNWTAFDDINKRVKYLDKNDIESLGWMIDKNIIDDNINYFIKNDYNNSKLIIEFAIYYTGELNNPNCRNSVIKIYRIGGDPIKFNGKYITNDQILFFGNIKNKSELIVLLKQLDI